LTSRTIRSLTYFLAKYSGIKIYFASPRVLKMKDDLKEYLAEHQVPFSESFDSAAELREIAAKADILYITQIPRDKFGDRINDYEQAKEIFRIDQEILKVLRRDTFIMHPFPRDYELPPEVDPDPRAAYFDQIRYGQFLRMGLLCHVLRVAVA
jgi:aspartate carbamoyltransferase catalytic subunit